MQEHTALPVEFYEALRQGSRSTRIEDAQDHLLAVVNDVAYEFSFDPSEIKTLWLAVREQVIVSARTHPLRSVDRLREAVKQGSRFDSAVALLNHLFHDQGDVLVRIVRDATVRVDTMEDSVLQGHLRHTRGELGKQRRVLVRLPWVRPDDVDELRQATEEFSLVIRDLAALQERIKLLQEELVAQVGEQTNRSVFTLTVVTVLALPINILAGLFGMNVGGVPLAQNEHGFAIVALVVATFTAVAGWLAFRRRD
jgi:zinc transporter